MTIFDIAPLSEWRKAHASILKELAKSYYFDTVKMMLAMEVQRLYCKRLQAENAELLAQNAELRKKVAEKL